MDTDTAFPLANSICEGCLSCDRKLVFVDKEIEKVYYNYIHEKLRKQACLVLCWECNRNIRKFIIFKQRCLFAKYLLNEHVVSTVKPTSLSNLSVSRNSTQLVIHFKDEECQDENLQDPQSYVHNSTDLCIENQEFVCNSKEIHSNKYESLKEVNLIGETEVSLTSKINNEIVLTSMEQNLDSKPDNFITLIKESKCEIGIPFIKVEEDVLEELEGCYLDNNVTNQDDIDSKDFTSVLNKHDDNKSNTKCQTRKNKIIEHEFDDSDEEPLNNKRTKSLKEKKRKKSKENGVIQNVKRRREKPAGVVSNPRVIKKLQQLNVPEGQLEMVVLSWEQVEEERQKAISSVVFTRHVYRCHHCIVGFNHKHKLDNHMKKHDPSSGDMVCEVCKVRCKDSHSLSAHKRRHRVRWRCCLCGGVWSRAGVAADHAARQHRAPPPTHTCAVCGHAEPTLGKLRNHIKNHSERQKCDLCGKTFRDRTSLRTHLFIHSGEKEYSCPKCDKRFLFKKAMEVHLVTHEASAHLYCYQCDMNFKNRMSFTQHMKYSLKHIHPDKLKYACQLCDKKFVKAVRLEEHNLAVHLKITPIRCATAGCNFACSSRPVLRTHMRMVHRNARARRNHVCHTCGKTYTTKKTLEGHIRSHTGERPFKCPLCPSTFGYEAALYNHNKLVHLKANRRTIEHPPPQITATSTDAM